jgi:hypothetical protein
MRRRRQGGLAQTVALGQQAVGRKREADTFRSGRPPQQYLAPDT